jgi:hypothetical protein
MVEQITTKIMTGGIEKYSKNYGLETKQVQIRISKNLEKGALKYEICKSWNPQEEVSFKDILNKKIDILGYEAMATPFLIKSIELYEKEFDVSQENISVILFLNGKKINLAVYDKIKNIKLVTLSKHFECLGM